MERYCEIVAGIKVRTSNKKRRHLKQWGYDRKYLLKQPPAVRFQARHSNDCWQFDLSPSDLKEVKEPLWFQEGKGRPLLMLYSAVDDRSGVAYQEYHGVYGEDVDAALRFLFNAMASKENENFPFQGIPKLIYMDNGPIAKSLTFRRVMHFLDVEIQTHMPGGKDGRCVTARSKGKVEGPFRTVKEMHETLYHFHEPKNEKEANAWLMQFLLRYNSMQHRSESHSRIENWLQNLPESGIREMCSWDRFCTFAREPERRKVVGDARISIDGIPYQVDPDLAGEDVILWWGIFDNELYNEIMVSKPLSVEKERIHLGTLITALFYDLAMEEDVKIPTQPERREHKLRQLIRRRNKPLAPFIDEAHDLHARTLVDLKRLFEIVRDGGSLLSVVLIGHPKLRNELLRPTMEEIGSRAAMFVLEGIQSSKRQYISGSPQSPLHGNQVVSVRPARPNQGGRTEK
jgi:hypothetical protein